MLVLLEQDRGGRDQSWPRTKIFRHSPVWGWSSTSGRGVKPPNPPLANRTLLVCRLAVHITPIGVTSFLLPWNEWQCSDSHLQDICAGQDPPCNHSLVGIHCSILQTWNSSVCTTWSPSWVLRTWWFKHHSACHPWWMRHYFLLLCRMINRLPMCSRFMTSSQISPRGMVSDCYPKWTL